MPKFKRRHLLLVILYLLPCAGALMLNSLYAMIVASTPARQLMPWQSNTQGKHAINMPSTPADIDECEGVVCGGASKCKNEVNQFRCECAEGWAGGGVNKTCIGVEQ